MKTLFTISLASANVLSFAFSFAWIDNGADQASPARHPYSVELKSMPITPIISNYLDYISHPTTLNTPPRFTRLRV